MPSWLRRDLHDSQGKYRDCARTPQPGVSSPRAPGPNCVGFRDYPASPVPLQSLPGYGVSCDNVRIRVGGQEFLLPELLQLHEELARDLHQRDRVHTYGSFHIADLPRKT